ncbi:MAG: efflux RND transporter periplasmic adaptor subunit, partial [Acidobacteriota bacterium]|nr:efflux RND transporter periplasmic adaptor subunit [Acidobacteriota bacterium]
PAPAGGAMAGGGLPPALVTLATARPVAIDDASEYVATMQSLSSTNIKPEVEGQVTAIDVHSGERVRRGTPLFRIDARRQRAMVSSQDATLTAQRASVAYAKQQLERSRTLLKAGAISQQEFDQAQTSFDTAAAQLTALEAQLHQSQVTLDYYDVTAPTDGIVGDIPVRVGMHVTTDTILTTVDLNQEMEAYVPVPLDRSADLRVGLPLTLTDGAGTVLAQAKISYVSPNVDGTTQTVLAKARLRGTGALRASQFVRARIVWGSSQGLLVPLLSVVRINGQPFLYLAESQNGHLVARQQPVQLGQVIGNNVQVTSGLAAGQQFVESGTQRLFDGAPLRPSA